MGITNWQLFQKILSAWLLSLAFVVYSFYLIRNRKVYAFRKIIWSIACDYVERVKLEWEKNEHDQNTSVTNNGGK